MTFSPPGLGRLANGVRGYRGIYAAMQHKITHGQKSDGGKSLVEQFVHGAKVIEKSAGACVIFKVAGIDCLAKQTS